LCWSRLATSLTTGPPRTPLALVAVAAMGGRNCIRLRRDIMLLLKRGDPSSIGSFAEPFVRFLWTSGLRSAQRAQPQGLRARGEERRHRRHKT